ncbi:MAG: hypothetical protein HQL75_08760 [Magnetococcales bacterium]|nr:hypothetical protein [Magnetococcales bacterium]
MGAWWKAITTLCDDHLTAPIVVALFYLIIYAVIMLMLFCKQHWKPYGSTWFMPKKRSWNDELDWEDIVEILDGDPIGYNEKNRDGFYEFLKNAFDFMKELGIILATVLIIYWIPMFLVNIRNCEFLSKNGPLAVIITGVTVIVTLAIGLKKIQAKVKSENRQVWINDLRNTVAEVIALLRFCKHFNEQKNNERLTCYDTIPHEQQPKELEGGNAYNLDQKLIKLELLINPSEKDHRMLLWMLRKCSRGEENIVLDKIFLCIKDIRNVEKMEFFEKLDREKNLDFLISYVVRLSNAILKREWERVKYLK